MSFVSGGSAGRVAPDAAISATGKLTLKVEPCPLPGLEAETVPPCTSTRWRTMARPRPEAAIFPGGSAVGLAESIEDMRQKFRFDTDAGVVDGDLDPVSDAHQPRIDAAACVRELDCVGEHVPEDLMNAVAVTKNHAARDRRISTCRVILFATALGRTMSTAA